ncbi:MAG TPA: tetratricopeptide repeat protein [Ferruginibacter sp.]|nr:tetratricopeptide repeat protein [Ferruginibacter sp.]
MKKIISLLIITWFAAQPCTAQNEKDKTATTKDILSSINLDSAGILKDNSLQACKCIDSILQARTAGKDDKPLEDIAACIDKQVTTYQMTVKLFGSLTGTDKNIAININPASSEYKRYYTDIESWLRDSCSAMKILVASNDKTESEFSYSKNPEAIKQYNDGLKYFTKELYSEALAFFKKAVETDPSFVYAWDNLGICYRRTGDLDNALMAYNRSLKIYPEAKTPLQNIPVIHELRKDYDKALQAYKKMLQYYPDDVEAYYGMGRILIAYSNDLEKGLDNMCKAYNIYLKMKSPYRLDAEKNISYVYAKMKEQGKEDVFHKILKDNNISIK